MCLGKNEGETHGLSKGAVRACSPCVHNMHGGLSIMTVPAAA